MILKSGNQHVPPSSYVNEKLLEQLRMIGELAKKLKAADKGEG